MGEVPEISGNSSDTEVAELKQLLHGEKEQLFNIFTWSKSLRIDA